MARNKKKRLKIYYVAMTRPTHLLCLAVNRSTFENGPGSLDHGKVQKLKDRGWQVECV